MAEMFYIADLRPEFARNPLVTFWRPKNAGYSYAVEWAGLYSHEEIKASGNYHTRSENGRMIRFGVPEALVKSLAEPPPTDQIFGRSVAVTCLPNTGAMRSALRRNALFRPLRRYVVAVDGCGSAEYLAGTASKARAMAYRAWRDAGLPGSFIEFQRRASLLAMGAAPS